MDELMRTPAGRKEILLFSCNEDGKSHAGCTATTVLITPSEIYCANAGDSRTVMSRDKKAEPLSNDHKPANPVEHRRIYNACGFVDQGRVNGHLALSRAIGDFDYKINPCKEPAEQAVTCMPDITVIPIEPN